MQALLRLARVHGTRRGVFLNMHAIAVDIDGQGIFGHVAS